MTANQLVATLGQPTNYRPTEYAPGVKGPEGFWYHYLYDDASFHMLSVTVDSAGTVINLHEWIELARFANGGATAVHFTASETERGGTVVFNDKLYDLRGNERDVRHVLEDFMRSYGREQGQ